MARNFCGGCCTNLDLDVEKEEERQWKFDGLSEHVHPPVVIPLHDDDDESEIEF